MARRLVFSLPGPNAPESQPPASGLHDSTPMPYFWHIGSTSFSMLRTRMEYGGCSVTKRSRARRSATHCASTISWAGKVELPK